MLSSPFLRRNHTQICAETGEQVTWCRFRQDEPSVRDFPQQHPRVQLHFTPTYSPWLNQVEIWFAKIEREVIARGIFTSAPDLARKLRRYVNAYSANARLIQWKCSDPSRRLRTNEFTATGH